MKISILNRHYSLLEPRRRARVSAHAKIGAYNGVGFCEIDRPRWKIGAARVLFN